MEKLLTDLAQQGVAYLLLAISIAANIFLYREVKSSMDKRIDDIRESNNAALEPLRAVKQTVDYILNVLQNGQKQGK